MGVADKRIIQIIREGKRERGSPPERGYLSGGKCVLSPYCLLIPDAGYLIAYD